jgi:hypothetical protein
LSRRAPQRKKPYEASGPRKSRKLEPPSSKPRRITRCTKMDIERKTLTRRKLMYSAQERKKGARIWISNATKPLLKRTWCPSSSATPPKPTGKLPSLTELKRGFRPEEIAASEARYRQALATLEKYEHGNRREDVEAAKAALAYDEARYRERQVLAPNTAFVEVLDVRPGDLVAPNTPVATLLEPDQIYVRIYIPETELGLVKVGQNAEIHVDSFPKKAFDGIVEQINQQAEFLPRNVQTREERVHQVFGVKVRINDPSGQVRAGMAADVKLKP